VHHPSTVDYGMEYKDQAHGLGRKTKKHGKRRPKKQRQKLGTQNAMDAYIRMFEDQVQVDVDNRLLSGVQQRKLQHQQQQQMSKRHRNGSRGLHPLSAHGLWKAGEKTVEKTPPAVAVYPAMEDREEGELVIQEPDRISRPTTPSSVPSLSLLPEVLSPSKLSQVMILDYSSPQLGSRPEVALDRPRSPLLDRPRNLVRDRPRTPVLDRPRTPLLSPQKAQLLKSNMPSSPSALPSSLPVLSSPSPAQRTPSTDLDPFPRAKTQKRQQRTFDRN
jgi:hypothetical protein